MPTTLKLVFTGSNATEPGSDRENLRFERVAYWAGFKRADQKPDLHEGTAMKATRALSSIVMLATTGCTDRPAAQDSVPPPHPLSNAPIWEIGEDIAGKTVMIDGKQEVIPDDMAESKRKMDAAAKETLDAMHALEKQRLARFNDPDMKP